MTRKDVKNRLKELRGSSIEDWYKNSLITDAEYNRLISIMLGDGKEQMGFSPKRSSEISRGIKVNRN